MTPDEIRALIRDELSNILKSDRYVFDKHVQLLDTRHIQLGVTNGTKIGTATTQKLGFFNATPVVRQSSISSPAGGGTGVTDAIDPSSRTAIGQIKTALTNLGLTS